jgi:hypothetical protein
MDLRILGLSPEPFLSLFSLSDAALAARCALRVIADEKPGFPCRVSLEDAEPGEELVLVNYEHQPAPTPFRASHAIYVRRAARERYDRIGEVPEQLRSRPLSLRAFDARGMLVGAELVDGAELEPAARALLASSAVEYLHAHFARPGCYAARIERA